MQKIKKRSIINDCLTILFLSGTNEANLIKETIALTPAERQLVKTKYASLFGHDFVYQMKNEIGGYFLETMLALYQLPYEYESHIFYNAIKVSFDTYKNQLYYILVKIKSFYSQKG